MNRHAGSDALQFTASVWKEGKNIVEASRDKVSTIFMNTFPFLDIDLFWEMGVLAFRMYKKVNNQLKCLNSHSYHTPATMKAIPHGVCLRLASLTSISTGNKDKSLSVLYPEHAAALMAAGLVEGNLPSVDDVIANHEEIKQRKSEKERRKEREA